MPVSCVDDRRKEGKVITIMNCVISVGTGKSRQEGHCTNHYLYLLLAHWLKHPSRNEIQMYSPALILQEITIERNR